jgi:hypothetical protein
MGIFGNLFNNSKKQEVDSSFQEINFSTAVRYLRALIIFNGEYRRDEKVTRDVLENLFQLPNGLIRDEDLVNTSMYKQLEVFANNGNLHAKKALNLLLDIHMQTFKGYVIDPRPLSKGVLEIIDGKLHEICNELLKIKQE